MRREVEIDRMSVHERVVAERDQRETARHEQFARVVLPPVRQLRRQGQDRDGRQQHREGQHCGRWRRGADAAVGRSVWPVGFSVGFRLVGGLCLYQQITTILRPAEGDRGSIGHQQGGDAGERPGRPRNGGGFRGGPVRGWCVVHDGEQVPAGSAAGIV